MCPLHLGKWWRGSISRVQKKNIFFFKEKKRKEKPVVAVSPARFRFFSHWHFVDTKHFVCVWEREIIFWPYVKATQNKHLSPRKATDQTKTPNQEFGWRTHARTLSLSLSLAPPFPLVLSIGQLHFYHGKEKTNLWSEPEPDPAPHFLSSFFGYVPFLRFLTYFVYYCFGFTQLSFLFGFPEKCSERKWKSNFYSIMFIFLEFKYRRCIGWIVKTLFLICPNHGTSRIFFFSFLNFSYLSESSRRCRVPNSVTFYLCHSSMGLPFIFRGRLCIFVYGLPL